MNDLPPWLNKIPNWFWYACIPLVGGLAIVYAGNKSKTPVWVGWGVGFIVASFVLSFQDALVSLLWLGQIGTAFYIRPQYLIKTTSKIPTITNVKTAQMVSQIKGKVDINTCSKDDMVYTLGLPIIYANDIEDLRHEGYIFTHLEELIEVVGLPDKYLSKLEPLVTFSYDINKEVDVSWRRLNSFPLDELIACNLEENVARRIIQEREKRGPYKSLMDVRKRTGISINAYRHLV